MLDELTPEQFDEWEAFAMLRPFGPLAKATQLATLVQATAMGECELDGILRAWGFDLGDDAIDEADVMTAEESEAFAKMAFGIS